jgi:hypothetical protein
MPAIRPYSFDPPGAVSAIDFLYGEGTAADDPSADSLVAFGRWGVHLYNPSDSAGAAGENQDAAGDWGGWHRICTRNASCLLSNGLVTAAGSILVGSQQLSRGTDRGRSWAYGIEGFGPFPFLESALPSLVGPGGAPGILVGAGDDGTAFRSLDDGAPGTWHVIGSGFGYPQALGEVPPSPSLPDGRILYGVWNGITYSDDGGLSFVPSNAYGQAAYIAYAFAFLPVVGHPYGGVAFAGLHNTAFGAGPSAEVHRSDDGGATWTLAHRFTAAELDLPVFTGGDFDVDLQNVTALLAMPDGALWAGVSFSGGASNPARGGLARSTDGGATWARADEGMRDGTGRAYQTNQMRLGRDGRLYAATERGVWRTTAAVVAAEGAPDAPSELSLAVSPNPSSGSVTLAVSASEAAATLVVTVFGTTGRVVSNVYTGPVAAGEHRYVVDTRSWAAGVYVAQVWVRGEAFTTRFTVAR